MFPNSAVDSANKDVEESVPGLSEFAVSEDVPGSPKHAVFEERELPLRQSRDPSLPSSLPGSLPNSIDSTPVVPESASNINIVQAINAEISALSDRTPSAEVLVQSLVSLQSQIMQKILDSTSAKQKAEIELELSSAHSVELGELTNRLSELEQKLNAEKISRLEDANTIANLRRSLLESQ